MYDYVLYHDNCYDGFGSALVAWLKLGDNAKYIPVNYGQYPPDLPKGSKVLICDFSYPREQLLNFALDHEVQVLDHHKTAQAALEGIPYATFDMNHSGAYLTWKHFYPESDVPEFILYLEDRDLWTFRLPGSRGVSQALRAYPFDFNVWNSLMYDVEQLRQEGPVIERFTQQMVNLMCDNSFEKVIGGHLVPVANATVFFSEVGEELCIRNPNAPFAAYYLDRKDGKRQWGLRSRGGFDCSEVAKKLGGGGHPGAAGFVEELK